jgi:very-short-patch-repair endonuclease
MPAIEIDGESHFGNEERDKIRQNEIEKFGVKFLRFDESEIFYNLDEVVRSIEEFVVTHP